VITLIEAYRRSQTGNRLINYKVTKYLHFKQLRKIQEEFKRSILQFFRGSRHSLMKIQKTVQLKKKYTDSLPGLSNEITSRSFKNPWQLSIKDTLQLC
jgi:hypothetical protein